jgi:hypothetical protein
MLDAPEEGATPLGGRRLTFSGTLDSPMIGAVRGVAVLSLAALAFVLPTGSAAGKEEPGVHVDPGSPAGKEYAIPLESARREGAGGGVQGSGGGGGSASGSSPPLFGAGISQAKRHSSDGGGKDAGSGDSGGGAAPSAAKSVAARADDGGSASLRTAGIAALVLLVGGGLGLGLRRALGSAD